VKEREESAWQAPSSSVAERISTRITGFIRSRLAKSVGFRSTKVDEPEMRASLSNGMRPQDINPCPRINDWDVHMLIEDRENIHARLFKSPGAKLAIVVFRGTEFTSVKNWQVDADIIRVRLELGEDGQGEHASSLVHEGFIDAVERILPQVRKWTNGYVLGLFDRIPDDWNLVFTGHSLGGALAMLAATKAEVQGWARKPDATVVFGAPRVADGNLSAWWESRDLCKKLLRVNTYNDMVHWMPFKSMWKWWEVGKDLMDCFTNLNDCRKQADGATPGGKEGTFSDSWKHVCGDSEFIVPSATKGVNENHEDFSPVGGVLSHFIDNCLFGYGYGVLHGAIADHDSHCGVDRSLMCAGAEETP